MVSCQGVARGVARPPNLTEELSNVPRENALVLQAASQFVLGLCCRYELAYIRGDVLREQFGQLAQLQ